MVFISTTPVLQCHANDTRTIKKSLSMGFLREYFYVIKQQQQKQNIRNYDVHLTATKKNFKLKITKKKKKIQVAWLCAFSQTKSSIANVKPFVGLVFQAGCCVCLFVFYFLFFYFSQFK